MSGSFHSLTAQIPADSHIGSLECNSEERIEASAAQPAAGPDPCRRWRAGALL
jgi:hypothetical protein